MWNFRCKKRKVSKDVEKAFENPQVGLIAQEVEASFPNTVEPKPYEPSTDKEIVLALEWQDNYEAAFLIRNLKKQNAVLKRKLTILQKKYDGVIKS